MHQNPISAGAKSAVYDCLVPFDDKSTENQSL